MRQQIAPWAEFILSRPGEVWVPGASIPGELGTNRVLSWLTCVGGRKPPASATRIAGLAMDASPRFFLRDTTTLVRDDRRGLAATADRRATWVTRHGPCTPPRRQCG